jgi:hypothetical protein
MVSLVGGLLLAGCGSGGDSPVAAQNSGVIDLSGVTQNWDKNLPSASRFTVLAAFGGAAVRDNNTGLVWEQTADGTTRTQPEATVYCASKTVGGTFGWRLPSVVELSSALDSSVPNFSPPVFNGVNGNIFWSATTNAAIPTQAWTVSFSGGGVVHSFVKGTSSWVWCVRGPMNADQY